VTRETFERQLDELESAVLELGEAVTVRLRRAVTAIERHDRQLARTVLEGDHEINERYLALESDCIDLFALQQPVAGDLRFVAASFKILTDLERIADLAANLGSYVVDLRTDSLPEVELVDIGQLAGDMLEDALSAFVTGDPDRCHHVAERDDELDARCERAADRIIRDLVERDPLVSGVDTERLLAQVHRLLLMIRDLERVGDHAVNIAARTLYMVEGDDRLLY
jgi:phosphate transport system protein